MKFDKKWAVATELGAIISLQTGASAAKYLFLTLGPAVTSLLRVGLAGILLGVTVRPKVSRFTREQWKCLLFYGISTGAMNLLFYYGIQRVPLGIGVAVEFLGPLGVALAGSRKWYDFLWAALAMTGVGLIVPWRVHDGMVDPVGLLFIILAGIMWAMYIIAGNRIAGKVSSPEAATCGMWIATVVVLPFALFSGMLLNLNWTLLGIGLFVAVFSSALPFTLELLVMKKLPAKTFSILSSLDPAFAALSGLIFLGELLTLAQTAAIFCIMAASIGAAVCVPEKK